jgi:hypothetical protein
MKINKIVIAAAISLMIFVINGYAGESIKYLISPFGRAEYNDLGTVEFEGKKVNLITFKNKVLFTEDAQKIYSDPENGLPYKIERTISGLWSKEDITREYDQKNFAVLVKNFKGKRLVSEQTIKADGPIQDVILFPFYLSRLLDLKVGMVFEARLPEAIKLEVVAIDEISVPAGKFLAYHFKSIPDKIEIWINKDTPRVPLKIQGKFALNYSMVMKNYSRNP